MLDTLDLFDPDLVRSIERTVANGETHSAIVRAQRLKSRIAVRRAKSEAHLAEVLPPTFEPGDSWHCISHGDIDSLSYLSHALRGVSHFDHVALSTWCMARADLEQLQAWCDTGRIDQLDVYVGEIFPSQYGAEYELLLSMARSYGVRVVVARNHSKVMLMRQADVQHLVCESSANVNTNPRIEQTAITHSRELYEFYCEFFAGLKTIDRDNAWASA